MFCVLIYCPSYIIRFAIYEEGHWRDIKHHAEGYTPKIALADAIFELKFKCV